MRVLAVDFGSKRIGLAVGDSRAGVASPKPAVASKEGLKPNAEVILSEAAREGAEAIAVGVPLAEDGGETPMSRVCRKLVGFLREGGIEVYEVDESLTSVTAENRLRGHDWTEAQRRKRRDSEAACLILERFFAEHAQA